MREADVVQADCDWDEEMRRRAVHRFEVNDHVMRMPRVSGTWHKTLCLLGQIYTPPPCGKQG